MNSVGFNLGLMVGPLISDGLSDSIGYYHMNVALGKLQYSIVHGDLANICGSGRVLGN